MEDLILVTGVLPIAASVEGEPTICERNGRYSCWRCSPTQRDQQERASPAASDLGPRVRGLDEYGLIMDLYGLHPLSIFSLVRAHRRIYLLYLFWTASRSFHLCLLFPRLRYALFLAVPLRSTPTRVPSHACPRFILSLDSSSSYCWCQARM